MGSKRPYRPDALVHLLNEVERELRAHGRTSSALMVRHAARAVAEDEGETRLPEERRVLM